MWHLLFFDFKHVCAQVLESDVSDVLKYNWADVTDKTELEVGTAAPENDPPFAQLLK